MFLVAGLGNPGRRYAATRHNVGFMLVDRLARDRGLEFRNFQRLAEVARWDRGEDAVLLAKPQTFMNESGRAVGALLRYFDIPVERCLVVYDDVALPLGKLRFRRQGSSGGHKGMASVIGELGTVAVPRLRLGIGREGVTSDLRSFVLDPFSREELPVVDEMLETAAAGVQTFLAEGIERAMALYN
ncbi:MAG: aminoacyl-tRNA hydrolase [Acidobacteriota bacterium]